VESPEGRASASCDAAGSTLTGSFIELSTGHAQPQREASHRPTIASTPVWAQFLSAFRSGEGPDDHQMEKQEPKPATA